MKDTNLLPHILPNVFAISNDLSATQFASMVLPSLRPLFAVKEPPQNMLTLLDNLSVLQNKTEKAVFRERECVNNPSYTIRLTLLRGTSTCLQRTGIRTCSGKN
jgi:hypothetical protein